MAGPCFHVCSCVPLCVCPCVCAPVCVPLCSMLSHHQLYDAVCILYGVFLYNFVVDVTRADAMSHLRSLLEAYVVTVCTGCLVTAWPPHHSQDLHTHSP
jgi:hypothetical protein